jgi:hypothetical protein
MIDSFDLEYLLADEWLNKAEFGRWSTLVHSAEEVDRSTIDISLPLGCDFLSEHSFRTNSKDVL